MDSHLLEHYAKLTEFLGHTLGPDYEIALHDLTDKNQSIVAIANSHVSGRQIGAPLTNVGLKILRDKSYEGRDYILNYRGMSEGGRMLRSSTLFIKQNGEPVGMLCINFDDSRYRAVSEDILRLCHPDNFVDTNFQVDTTRVLSTQEDDHGAERVHNSPQGVAGEAVARELSQFDITTDRLTPEERIRIISALERDGVFLLKGAVKDVADALCCSQASVYRYLQQIRAEKD